MSMLDKLNLPYPIETVESFNGEYSQEEIEIAEAIFAWWISGKGYEQWYAENIAQQKIDFDISKDWQEIFSLFSCKFRKGFRIFAAWK